MSSATLTKREARQRAARQRPPAPAPAESHAPVSPAAFFVLAALATAALAVILLRGQGPAAVGLVVFTVAAAGLVGVTFFQVLAPLVGVGGEQGPTIGGRARAALERDKALTLRAIKELEFDRAMGKVSETDFVDMRDRLRARAMRLMRQLEGGGVYRQQIEQAVSARLGDASTRAATPTAAPGACESCGTPNDADARFCKRCGARLPEGAHA